MISRVIIVIQILSLDSLKKIALALKKIFGNLFLNIKLNLLLLMILSKKIKKMKKREKLLMRYQILWIL